MNAVIGTAYAALREELQRSFANVAWPTPERGFIAYVLGEFDGISNELSGAARSRLAEGPVLASLGYLCSSSASCLGKELADEWYKSLVRLLQRDPFPRDRESYFFRPLELLGICLGAFACPSVSGDARAQLKRILDSGRERLDEADIWGHEVSSFAAWISGVHWKRRSLPAVENLTLEESCLIRWLTTRGKFAEETGLDVRIEVLDRRIIRQCFLETNAVGNAAKAALTKKVSDELVNERISSELDRTFLNPVNTVSATEIVSLICRRFPAVVTQLSVRHDERVTIAVKDEYDVQDLFHSLLRIYFDDIRSEEWTPSRGGSSTRMDFLLKKERVVVEVKMTRKGLDQKGVLVELTEDIERYRAHPDCKTLVCFVYDPSGACENPAALENDLSGTRGTLNVLVHVAPRI
jgi:hypothetical protein